MGKEVNYKVTMHWTQLGDRTLRFHKYHGVEAALAVAFDAGIPVTVEKVEERW